MKNVAIAALALSVSAFPAVAQDSGDTERGAGLFGSACAICHQIGEGAAHGLGPHLNGLLGRPIGGAEGFANYSEALRERGEAGEVWDTEALRTFLTSPAEFAPGTTMAFVGIDDEGELDDLVAYLEQASAENAEAASPAFEVPASLLELEGNVALGRHLADGCASCHGRDEASNGIPALRGWDRDSMVAVLFAYREGLLTDPLMQVMASGLSDADIAALAAYFAALGGEN